MMLGSVAEAASIIAPGENRCPRVSGGIVTDVHVRRDLPVKRVMEPIIVLTPLTPSWTLVWRERTYHVEAVLARWFYRGKWWLDPQLEGERRSYFRLSCAALAPARTESRRRMNLHASVYNQPSGSLPARPEANGARIFEVFHRLKEGVESWTLSGVVD